MSVVSATRSLYYIQVINKAATDQSPGQARSRKRIWAIVVGLLACSMAGLFFSWAGNTRQSAVRAKKHAQLLSVAQAARIYEQDSGRKPTVDALLAAGLLDIAVIRDFSRAQPIAETSTASVTTPLIVQTVPCRAVSKGEAWGGPGETIDKDLPACRFVLMPDWSVVPLDEPDFQRDWAGILRLDPLK